MNGVAMTRTELLAVFRDTLVSDDLFAPLRLLNETTDYRFTGIYWLDGKWVKSVLLFDREHPNVQIGHDVLWDESYCRITATDGVACEITNSLTDARLTTHGAREAVQCYCAVLLRSPEGKPLGTICHYDVRPRQTPAGGVETLKALQSQVEKLLWARVNGALETVRDSVRATSLPLPWTAQAGEVKARSAL